MPTEKLRREWLPVKPAEPSAVTTLSQSYGCQLPPAGAYIRTPVGVLIYLCQREHGCTFPQTPPTGACWRANGSHLLGVFEQGVFEVGLDLAHLDLGGLAVGLAFLLDLHGLLQGGDEFGVDLLQRVDLHHGTLVGLFRVH